MKVIYLRVDDRLHVILTALAREHRRSANQEAQSLIEEALLLMTQQLEDQEGKK